MLGFQNLFFFTFYSGISSSFIQVGLTALSLIGPFLYLYISSSVQEEKSDKNYKWLLHIIPVVIVMIILSYNYPYLDYRHLWSRRYFGIFQWLIYAQWFIYILLSGYKIRSLLEKAIFRHKQIEDQDFWLISIFLGVIFIFIAYLTSGYTSYIVGALSFSFTFYLLVIIWIFKRKQNSVYYLNKSAKYANKKIGDAEAKRISNILDILFEGEMLHKKPDLKLPEFAKKLGVSTHYLSQYFNDNLDKSFTSYINELRITSALEMIESNQLLTMEAIGNECGFRSNSSFYASFKKLKGITPAQYRKTLPDK